MNPHQLSRAEINWRLALYVTLSIDGFLLSDPFFIAHVSPWVRLFLGGLNAGLLVVRAFIDKSPSQGKNAESEPIEVTATKPLPTQEVGNGDALDSVATNEQHVEATETDETTEPDPEIADGRKFQTPSQYGKAVRTS